MRSLAAELAIRFRRDFTIQDADYHLRRHKLRRLGETVSHKAHYVSDTCPTNMIENESRYFIAVQVEYAEEF